MARPSRGPVVAASPARPLSHIIGSNVLTPYNALLTALTVMVAATQRWPDTLVGLFVVLNSGIGIAQEVWARRTLERLSVIQAPTVRLERERETVVVAVEDLVAGDVMVLQSGDQVPADGNALSAGLEVDESLLSGESEPVAKHPGDLLLSGSIVVAGTGTVKVTHVGAEAYANQLTSDVRRLRRTRSVLMEDTNQLIVVIIVALVVVGPLLLWGAFRREASWQDAVVDTAAAMGAMVPDGLVLLTSLAFLLSAARLARRGVLTHQLAAVEVLARADLLVLDKTGTLTDGTTRMVGIELLPIDGSTNGVTPEDRRTSGTPGDTPSARRAVIREALGAMAADPGSDQTLDAIHRALPPPTGWTVAERVAFSSTRRWSGADFADHGTWAIGAPELLLTEPESRGLADRHASEGTRVLVLSRGATGDFAALVPVALVLLEEQIRHGAAEAVAYLLRQGMEIKVVSGDHPATVAAVARKVGIPNADRGSAFTELASSGPRDLATDLADHGVIGRASPDEKRTIVRALQDAGHVVAMTGDGVNDALALKVADLGIAMASGAPATRGVADLVLLDSDFTSLPSLVEEGRRVLGSIERVAHLFMVKVAYAAIVAIVAGIVARPYPFLPRQLTWTATLTIGIPGLVLATERCDDRFRPGYLRRVLHRSVPTGAVAAAGLFLLFEIAGRMADGTHSGRAAASIAAVVIGLGVVELSGSRSTLRHWVTGAMTGLGAATLWWPWSRHQLELDLPATVMFVSVAGGGLVVGAHALLWRR